MFSSSSHFSQFRLHRGFGLIELLVSITIITLVTGVVLAKHNAFNGAVLLRNQAYEVAFAIRQAQLLAVSGANPNESIVQQYGIYFSKSDPNSYFIFHDEDANGRYDSGEAQIGPVGRLDNRFEIRDIFFNNTTAVAGVNNNLSITFVRPNFDALFRRSAGGYLSGSVFIDIARLGATGNGVGEVRRVEVTSSGQITVTTY